MAGSIELLLDAPLSVAGPLWAVAEPLVQGLFAQTDETGLMSLIFAQIWLWLRVALGIGLARASRPDAWAARDASSTWPIQTPRAARSAAIPITVSPTRRAARLTGRSAG